MTRTALFIFGLCLAYGFLGHMDLNVMIGLFIIGCDRYFISYRQEKLEKLIWDQTRVIEKMHASK